MYRLGRRSPHKQKLYAGLILLLAGCIIAGIWAANTFLKPETTLGTSDGIIRHVDVVTPPTKVVSNTIFSLAIPKNWQAAKSQFIPAASYAWRGTGPEESARSLEVYADAIPASMAVNKLLPVRANGNQLVAGDSVSDNCVSFTDSDKMDKKTGKILAKWSGVNFYCDAGNYARNVVGTGSPDAINSVTLTGKLAGTHRFFFLYTDHGAEPDYTVFTDALNSFTVR